MSYNLSHAAFFALARASLSRCDGGPGVQPLSCRLPRRAKGASSSESSGSLAGSTSAFPFPLSDFFGASLSVATSAFTLVARAPSLLKRFAGISLRLARDDSGASCACPASSSSLTDGGVRTVGLSLPSNLKETLRPLDLLLPLARELARGIGMGDEDEFGGEEGGNVPSDNDAS